GSVVVQMRYGVNAWIAFALGIAGGALVGAAIGTLAFRSGLKGSYFALVTLAFAEVLRILASVAPITGAGVGILIALDLRPQAFQFQSRAPFYWIVLALVAIALLIVRLIERSRFGAWLVAVRGNEDPARAVRGDTGGGRGGRCRYRAGQDCRHDDFRRHHRRRRRFLRAILSVHRLRHRLWPLDFHRSFARPHRRRHRHRIRSAARRAGHQNARRNRQA